MADNHWQRIFIQVITNTGHCRLSFLESTWISMKWKCLYGVGASTLITWSFWRSSCEHLTLPQRVDIGVIGKPAASENLVLPKLTQKALTKIWAWSETVLCCSVSWKVIHFGSENTWIAFDPLFHCQILMLRSFRNHLWLKNTKALVTKAIVLLSNFTYT